MKSAKSSLKTTRSLWPLAFLLAMAHCVGPGDPPAQEQAEQLVRDTWAKRPPAAFDLKPPCAAKGGSGAMQGEVSIIDVRLADKAVYGRPVADDSSPRVFYWPVTVEVSVTCSRTPASESPKSLVGLPDSGQPTTIQEGRWNEKLSYMGNLVRQEDGSWVLHWPQ